jgi:hypothetical protein
MTTGAGSSTWARGQWQRRGHRRGPEDSDGAEESLRRGGGSPARAP